MKKSKFNNLKRKKVITDIKEIDKIIKCIDYYGLNVITIGKGGDYKTYNKMKLFCKSHDLSSNMIIELKDTKLEITTKWYDNLKPTTYIFSLNDEDIIEKSGHKCFAVFNQYFKVRKADTYNNNELNRWFNEETGKYVCSASPIVDYNSRYERQELLNCYEYDLNSAYSSSLLEYIPDINSEPTFGLDIKVKNNQVGFLLNDSLTMVEPGGHADVIFNLIKTPENLLKFFDKWYNIKKNSCGKEKENAKAMLNLPIGYCQRYNPFLRSYVVNKCNKKISKLINEDTLFWNTDAIFSLKERTDLKIGNNIGEFKCVKIKKLKYIGNTYQLNDDIPVYRGIPKTWFQNFEKINGRKFDLLKDRVPTKMNTYEWNWEELRLEKINYEKIN